MSAGDAYILVRRINGRTCKLLRERMRDIASGEDANSPLAALCTTWEKEGGGPARLDESQRRAVCNRAIVKDLGRIDKLSDELATVAAAIYMRFCELAIESSMLGPPKRILKNGLPDGLEGYGKEVASCLSEMIALREMVAVILEIDPMQHPNARAEAAALALDVLNCGMPFAEAKPFFIRKLESLYRFPKSST